MHGQSCRDLFERSVTVSLSDEIEAKRGDASIRQHAGQSLIRRTVFAGKKPMTEDRDAARASTGHCQDCGDAMAMRIIENELFFHGGDCSRVGRKVDAGQARKRNQNLRVMPTARLRGWRNVCCAGMGEPKIGAGRTPKAQASLAVKRVKLLRSSPTVTQVAI